MAHISVNAASAAPSPSYGCLPRMASADVLRSCVLLHEAIAVLGAWIAAVPTTAAGDFSVDNAGRLQVAASAICDMLGGSVTEHASELPDLEFMHAAGLVALCNDALWLYCTRETTQQPDPAQLATTASVALRGLVNVAGALEAFIAGRQQ